MTPRTCRLDEADILTEVFVRGFIAVDYDDPAGGPCPTTTTTTAPRIGPGRAARPP